MTSPKPGHSDDARMSLGEHLEELRMCVARSLVALVAACLLLIWPSKYLLELIARPMVLALRRYGQPDTFLATGPAETILVYIKVVLIFGLIVASPYILYQLWSFVAAGLYPHEKRWVNHLVPASVGLFLTGVVFMYTFVLLVSLGFLVGFSGWLPLPQAEPTALERTLLRMPHVVAPESQPTSSPALVPLVEHDPPAPPVGAIWMNVNEGKLKVRWPDETHSVQLFRDDQRAMVTTHFRIGEYLSFVLVLTVAFGLAFQMPLVVLFLVRSGIVPLAIFRQYRKIVILIIVFIAGILAPPDLLSHLMLSVPMWLLFEVGLLLGARSLRRARAAEAADAAARSGPA
jgi:sec-independent protein translocase protein TatC